MVTQYETLPSLPQRPIVGNLLQFRRDRLGFLKAMSAISGDIGTFQLGSYPVIFINSAALSHKVLVEHAADVEKSLMLRKYMRPLLGDGLLSSDNATNRRQRRMMAPLFRQRHVATYGSTITAAAERVQASWATHQTIDVAHAMMQLSLGVISQTLFSTDISADTSTISAALTTVLKYSSKIADSLVNLPYHWPTPTHRRVAKAIAQLDSYIQAMVAARRQDTSGQYDDLLALLLRTQDEDDGAGMTDTQVRDELMTLFLGGQETTANALTWTWYLLSQHPETYQRMLDEIDSTLAGRTPTTDDLPQLPYTLCVFQESLRLYPPVYMIPRKASKDFMLDGYHIPEGMAIIISPYTMHRNPAYFPEPEQFRPERFDPSGTPTFPRDAYIPFSLGPRNCLGTHFALLEGHLALATIAQRVRFELQPGHQVVPEPSITLHPRDPLPMIIHRR